MSSWRCIAATSFPAQRAGLRGAGVCRDRAPPALSKEPDARYSTCKQFAVALGCQFLSGQAPSTEVLLEADAGVNSTWRRASGWGWVAGARFTWSWAATASGASAVWWPIGRRYGSSTTSAGRLAEEGYSSAPRSREVSSPGRSTSEAARSVGTGMRGFARDGIGRGPRRAAIPTSKRSLPARSCW